MNEVNEGNWEEAVVKSSIPVLVDFWAAWCTPCKALMPILEVISEEYAGRLKIVSVNVEDNMSLASQNNIQSVPSLILFINGTKSDKIVGSVNRNVIAKLLEKHNISTTQ
jgi:thioredoxin 1